MTFSTQNREYSIEKMATEEYDLLVIGGGITGAGIALDASLRGLKVALLEKNDYAWGTSSRSTKLIHGGLRYLKQLELRLVAEVGKERAIVHRLARHIVIPEKMLLPIIKGGSLSKGMTSLALWVYDKLAGVPKTERRKIISKSKTLLAEPLLKENALKAGAIYFEYRTDDARLTIENIKTASRAGANLLNHAEVIGFEYENDKIVATHVRDNLTSKTFTLKSKKVINATGPWVDTLRKKDPSSKEKRLQLSKGVHLVVPYEKLPIKQSTYFDVEADNRMIFAIPRGSISYLGTTDTFFDKNIDTPNVNEEDVNYILNATNAMFEGVSLQKEDVISSWVGLRPLIHEEGKKPSELSRKDEIFVSTSGLISIAGGKLTGYRKMAERVVNLVVKQLKAENPNAVFSACTTATHRLLGGDFESRSDMEKFVNTRVGHVKQIKVTQASIIKLFYIYGKEIDKIIERAFAIYPHIKNAEDRILAAEIWYGVHHEQVATINDFLIRRTGKLYFEPQTLTDEYLTKVALFMGDLLAWDEAKRYRELAAFKAEQNLTLGFITEKTADHNYKV